jgi:hypothetical protein
LYNRPLVWITDYKTTIEKKFQFSSNGVGDTATSRRRRPTTTDKKFRHKYKSGWKLRGEKGHGEAGLGKVRERPPFLLLLLFCYEVDPG